MAYLQQMYTKIFKNGGKHSFKQPKVVVFGNVLLDRTVQISDYKLLQRYQLIPNQRSELDSETLGLVTADACAISEATKNPGGSGLNSARILQHLGTPTLFCGAIGDDDTADELIETLSQYRIEARLQTVKDTPTGQCLCLVHGETSTLLANPGASMKFSSEFLKELEEKEKHSLTRPKNRKQILYIEGFFIPERENVCNYIMDNYVHDRHVLAINLSAKYIVKENFEQVLKMATKAFFIFGNSEEFETLMVMMGLGTFDEVAEQLIKEGGPKLLLVTHGSEGVHLITNVVNEFSHLKSVAYDRFKAPRVQEIVDTTGAGDAFVAAFMHGWLNKYTLDHCIQLGNDMSAKVITQIGCNPP